MSQRHPGHTRASRYFLNVDLDVESPEELQPLIDALEPAAYSMERPPGRASFELAADPVSPERAITEFVRLVAELPPAARAAWDRATRRTFDIGLQSGHEPFQEAHRIAPETLRAVAAIGAEIAITIYAVEP